MIRRPPPIRARQLEFISKYDGQRQRMWPEVNAFFVGLPPSLQPLGKAFARRLAIGTSPTSESEDVFKNPVVARVAYLPLWLISAYLSRGIDIHDASACGRTLSLGAIFGFCAIRIQDDLVDEDKPEVAIDELLLANLFNIESSRRLQRLFPSDSPVWDYYAKFWWDYTSAVGAEKARDRMGLVPFDDEAFRHVGNKAAVLKTAPVAVALLANHQHEIERLLTMMDAFNIGVQLFNDVQSLRRDVESGHYTAPIVAAALAAGFQPGQRPPPGRLRGALAMTGAVQETSTQALAYLARARAAAIELGISDLAECIAWQEQRLASFADPARIGP